MMKFKKIAIHLSAIGSLLVSQQVPANAQQAKLPSVKLQCKGSLTLYPNVLEPNVFSGVLVEITGQTMKIYGVPVFTSWEQGLALQVNNRNPAIISASNSDRTIAASVNRYSGELSLWRYEDASQRQARASFTATCMNPKPVF